MRPISNSTGLCSAIITFGWFFENGPGIDNKLGSRSGTLTPSYYLSDHLGTTTATVTASGGFSTRAALDSFGNVEGDFTRREYDTFNDLYYYRARMYDPKLGRFMSEDPIGFASGDVNLYAYVWNNPLHFTDPTGQFPENPYDLIPESGWTGIAYVGNFAAGFGDTVTLGGTNSVREWMGINGVVDPCSSVYFAGDITGTIVPMLMGGAGFARGALAMGGTKGSMVTRLGKGTGRFFYDNRTWGSVSRDYWGTFGPAKPNHIHHWIFPQRATGIPQGIRNAGFNQMIVPARFNSWMGYSKAGRVVESAIRGAVPGLVVGSAIQGAEWGNQKSIWQGRCGCD